MSFLDGDLSNADLLLCSGLANIKDFSDLNCNGALLDDDIDRLLGISKCHNQVCLPDYSVFERTLDEEKDDYLSEERLPVYRHEPNKSIPFLNRERIHYISDLHIPNHISSANCSTKKEILKAIKKFAPDCTKDLGVFDILLIAGDTSCDFECFKLFVEELRKATEASIIFVLGNHELWGFEKKSFSEIVSDYEKLISSEKMFLLQNSIVYKKHKYADLEIISERELSVLDETSIREKLSTSPLIFFGGLAFAGQNDGFNANNGLYKSALTREEEILETKKFNALYEKIKNALSHREVVVATHTPLTDWCPSKLYSPNFIYVNGHTHRNTFSETKTCRIYSDNQIGYYRKNIKPKSFYTRAINDVFTYHDDGIYEIKREEYLIFCRSKGFSLDFTLNYEKLYMLKRNGFYCFIIKTENGKLSILNGGATKAIKPTRIKDCYEEMEAIIGLLLAPTKKYGSLQKTISNLIKRIGGSGEIHGAIIDIDYFNHVFVNPVDLSVSAYYATNTRDKKLYTSIEALLKERNPQMFRSYVNCTVKKDFTSVIPFTGISSPDGVNCEETEMYSVSHTMKKVKKLESNILTIWPDNNVRKTLSPNKTTKLELEKQR